MESNIELKKDIEQVLSRNKENLPISALYWEVQAFDKKANINYFEMVSENHATRNYRSYNFYKPILTLFPL